VASYPQSIHKYPPVACILSGTYYITRMENTTTENVLESGQEVTVWSNIHDEWKDSTVGERWFYVGQTGDGDTHIVECEGLHYRVPGDEILEICEGW